MTNNRTESRAGTADEKPESIWEGEQCAERIWDEYKHRHDLCWKLIFQFTIAAVVISIVPYVQANIAAKLSYTIILLPLLAVALTALGWQRLSREADILGVIRKKHRELQGLKYDDQGTQFMDHLKLYFGCLFVLGCLNIIVVGLVWVPAVETSKNAGYSEFRIEQVK